MTEVEYNNLKERLQKYTEDWTMEEGAFAVSNLEELECAKSILEDLYEDVSHILDKKNTTDDGTDYRINFKRKKNFMKEKHPKVVDPLNFMPDKGPTPDMPVNQGMGMGASAGGMGESLEEGARSIVVLISKKDTIGKHYYDIYDYVASSGVNYQVRHDTLSGIEIVGSPLRITNYLKLFVKKGWLKPKFLDDYLNESLTEEVKRVDFKSLIKKHEEDLIYMYLDSFSGDKEQLPLRLSNDDVETDFNEFGIDTFTPSDVTAYKRAWKEFAKEWNANNVEESLKEWREDNGYRQHVWIVIDSRNRDEVIEYIDREPDGEGDFDDPDLEYNEDDEYQPDYVLDWYFDTLDDADRFGDHLTELGFEYNIEETDDEPEHFRESKSFKHVEDVWKYLTGSKSEDELKKRIKEVEGDENKDYSKWGSIYYDLFDDGSGATVIIDYQSDDEDYYEKEDIHFDESLKEKKKSEIDKAYEFINEWAADDYASGHPVDSYEEFKKMMISAEADGYFKGVKPSNTLYSYYWDVFNNSRGYYESVNESKINESMISIKGDKISDADAGSLIDFLEEEGIDWTNNASNDTLEIYGFPADIDYVLNEFDWLDFTIEESMKEEHNRLNNSLDGLCESLGITLKEIVDASCNLNESLDLDKPEYARAIKQFEAAKVKAIDYYRKRAGHAADEIITESNINENALTSTSAMGMLDRDTLRTILIQTGGKYESK